LVETDKRQHRPEGCL
jgi:hypothetical protein